MITSEYSDIISRFLLKVTDYNLPNIDEYLVNEMMAQWLHATLSHSYIRRLFSSFTMDDDVEEIEYELKNPTSDDEDREFVEELLAEGLVVQWVRPQYRSVLNTQQFFSNSEQKFYSQASHAAEIREMYKEAERGIRKLIRDRGTFYNDYIANG